MRNHNDINLICTNINLAEQLMATFLVNRKGILLPYDKALYMLCSERFKESFQMLNGTFYLTTN